MKKLRLILDDGTVVLSTHEHFEGVDGKTGAPKWSVDVKGLNTESPAYQTSDGKVLMHDRNTIYSIDPVSGNVDFRFTMDNEISKITPAANGSLVIVEELGTGILHAVDFRPMSEVAEDILEKNPPSSEEKPGNIQVEDEFVNIDGVKIPVGKTKRNK